MIIAIIIIIIITIVSIIILIIIGCLVYVGDRIPSATASKTYPHHPNKKTSLDLLVMCLYRFWKCEN